MEFITYDKSLKRKNYVSTKATININITGKINFNTGACELLNLYNDGKIIFQQEKERPENWYVKKVFKGNEQGFSVGLSSDPRSKGRHFNNSILTRAILRSIGAEKHCSCTISKTPSETNIYHYAIITHSKR